ncbi:arsenicals resistance [Dipsacomyces acuminosporus]|nr:arsenicals resistance [Dipsacomyces acuminosporus]
MEKLGFIDRFLTLWIFLCMLAGVLIGYYVPGVKDKLGSAKFADVNIPMAVGLIWMMYPILCKVRYEMLHKILNNSKVWKQIGFSMLINWIIAPLVMVVLGWATLPDLVEYRSGLVLVGTARCIAMVLVWNRLAGGDEEFCAIVVAINSILQVALYGPVSYLFVVIFSRGTHMGISMWPVVQSVLVFLGIPLGAAIITRFVLYRASPAFYNSKFIPAIAPTSLIALLFVIIVMFASQGHDIITNIKTVLRVIVPLLVYFVAMFFSVLAFCYYVCIPYKITVVQSFTAASNNFELAIAVAASVYGESSKEAMAATIGPLVEVPVLVAFVHVLAFIKAKWYDRKTELCGCKDD